MPATTCDGQQHVSEKAIRRKEASPVTSPRYRPTSAENSPRRFHCDGPILAAVTGLGGVALFDASFRSGALLIGGGQVVLPLL